MIVIPGEHWRYDDEDGGVGNVGVVLEVLESGFTLVWTDFFIPAFVLSWLAKRGFLITVFCKSFTDSTRNQLVQIDSIFVIVHKWIHFQSDYFIFRTIFVFARIYSGI